MTRISSLAAAVLLSICMAGLVMVDAKKKRTAQMPDLEYLGQSFVGASFGNEIANVSRAATKMQHWEEFDRVADTMRSLLIREASKGTRVLYFTIINPERQFNSGGDIGRYSDVLQYMLRGKPGDGSTGGDGADEAMMNAALGCMPMRERYCMEKISRASRLGTHMAVENCHRWNQAQNLLGDGSGGVDDMPDVSVDWRRICSECFGQRVQTSVRAFRGQGQECLDLNDEESENLAPQFPSNWTIDVSTRTTIGGMRMEERKLLPIGGRWMPIYSVHALVLLELAEGGVSMKALKDDGTEGAPITAEAIKESFPNTFFNFAIHLW